MGFWGSFDCEVELTVGLVLTSFGAGRAPPFAAVALEAIEAFLAFVVFGFKVEDVRFGESAVFVMVDNLVRFFAGLIVDGGVFGGAVFWLFCRAVREPVTLFV
jgi:hypothetical protein